MRIILGYQIIKRLLKEVETCRAENRSLQNRLYSRPSQWEENIRLTKENEELGEELLAAKQTIINLTASGIIMAKDFEDNLIAKAEAK